MVERINFGLNHNSPQESTPWYKSWISEEAKVLRRHDELEDSKFRMDHILRSELIRISRRWSLKNSILNSTARVWLANDQFKHRHEFIDIIDDRFRREIVAFIREIGRPEKFSWRSDYRGSLINVICRIASWIFSNFAISTAVHNLLARRFFLFISSKMRLPLKWESGWTRDELIPQS